jgi:hypothetical protein
MPEIKQRRNQGPVSGIEKPQGSATRYQKAPRPPPKRPTRHIHISITLLILACFILYANNQRLAPKKVVYQVGLEHLPEWYGVCSKEGKRIYTVPEDGGLGEVECVVVGGKEVRDTGSLGRRYLPKHQITTESYYSSYTKKMGRQSDDRRGRQLA